MKGATPFNYFSTWLFIIALFVLIYSLTYGLTRGWSNGVYWTAIIAGLITAFSLWWMLLNYINDSSWIHNRMFHEKQVFPETQTPQ